MVNVSGAQGGNEISGESIGPKDPSPARPPDVTAKPQSSNPALANAPTGGPASGQRARFSATEGTAPPFTRASMLEGAKTGVDFAERPSHLSHDTEGGWTASPGGDEAEYGWATGPHNAADKAMAAACDAIELGAPVDQVIADFKLTDPDVIANLRYYAQMDPVEFKQVAVQRVKNGEDLSVVAHELMVPERSLGNWVKAEQNGTLR